MVDRLHDEAGTTLAELLVVMVILGVIGSVTTVGIVSGFRAQLDSTNVAETLDGMRIATQRVRDFVRGATEVCSESNDTALHLWTDDGDGIVEDSEIDIFEVVEPVPNEPVFQRRSVSGDEVQLIRDDIIKGTVFEYDTGPTGPANQPPDLRCGTPGTGSAPVRRVDVLFSVEHPEEGQDPLETSTSVRLRNSDLDEPSRNKPPKASFTVSCPDPDRTCTFDGSDSSDPEDGTVSFYSWEVKDPDTGTVVHTAAGNNLDVYTQEFAEGTADQDYQVLLTVTDSDGAPDSTDAIAHPVEVGSNPPPQAEFTFSCDGLTCSFDASASTDVMTDGSTGTIDSYHWDFGGDGTSTEVAPTHSFTENGSYQVVLTVTDTEGGEDVERRVAEIGTNVFFVSKMTGTKSGSGNNRVATISTQLTLSVGGDPGEGLVITIEATDSAGVVLDKQSCDTNTNGNCSVSFVGLNNSRFPITGTVFSITNTGIYTYDKNQDTVTEVTVS